MSPGKSCQCIYILRDIAFYHTLFLFVTTSFTCICTKDVCRLAMSSVDFISGERGRSKRDAGSRGAEDHCPTMGRRCLELPTGLSSGPEGGKDAPVSAHLLGRLEPGFLDSPALPQGQIHLLSTVAQPHSPKQGKRRWSPVSNSVWHSQETSSNRFYSVAWRPLGYSLGPKRKTSQLYTR